MSKSESIRHSVFAQIWKHDDLSTLTHTCWWLFWAAECGWCCKCSTFNGSSSSISSRELLDQPQRQSAKSMQKRKQVTRTLISSNNLEQQSLLEEIQRHQPHIKITATVQKHRRQKGQKVRKRKARRDNSNVWRTLACSSHLSCRQSWFHSLDKKRGKNYIFGKSMKKYKLFLVTGREINWSIFTQSRILQLLCNNLACFYSFQINMLAS